MQCSTAWQFRVAASRLDGRPGSSRETADEFDATVDH